MTKKLLLMFVFALFVVNMSAQGRQSTILKSDQFFASLRVGERNASSAPLRVESLIKDNQPSVYALDGEAKTYGDRPVSLITDVRYLNAASAIRNAADIEIITIRISNASGLSRPINLADFANFPKLKYVYIVSDVPVTADGIQRLVSNAAPNLGVFYDISQRN